MSQRAPSIGSITLIGSGEMASGMSKSHWEILSTVPPPINAVFIDTPAGFQLNVDQISEKAVQYFKKHFNLDITVASFKSATDITPEAINRILAKLKDANYIFAGPGSPTYTVKNWQSTKILSALHSRLNNGAHLVLASAASIAIGAFALPVYEIYKVGENPGWIKGLGFLNPYGYRLAIIPHWNNKEGGTHDTRFCYMGESRLRMLEKQLPESVTILGIDEYTAVKFDFKTNKGIVLGNGHVTIRRDRQEAFFSSGSHFDLKLLSSERAGRVYKDADVAGKAPDETFANDFLWPETPDQDEMIIPSRLIDVLVRARHQLRNEKKWEMADEIRNRLLEVGVIVEDGRGQTTWRKG